LFKWRISFLSSIFCVTDARTSLFGTSQKQYQSLDG
jgi:hypothetical protein